MHLSTRTFLLSTLSVIWFLTPSPAQSCEGHCRTSILTSIQELFIPRLLVAHQIFYQTLFLNLPFELSESLVPVVNNIVYDAQQAAIDPAHVTDAKSIRGIFRAQVPYVGTNVTGFFGPHCCPSNCTGACCSDKQWPNVTTTFTKGEAVCGSEYSATTNMDLVFTYAQTILGAQSHFATVESVGSVNLIQQVAQQMGANNIWLARFLGNLHVGVKNLQAAYSILKSDFKHTYQPLGTYLICIDHTLDRPKFHPNAHTENCTKPLFPVPILSNSLGYQFPPMNYDLVDETSYDTKATSPLFNGGAVNWVADIEAELNAVTSAVGSYTSDEIAPKGHYAERRTKRDLGANDDLGTETQAEVGGAAAKRSSLAVLIGMVTVASLLSVG